MTVLLILHEKKITRCRITNGANNFRRSFDDNLKSVVMFVLNNDRHALHVGFEGVPFENGYLCSGLVGTLAVIVPQWRTN